MIKRFFYLLISVSLFACQSDSELLYTINKVEQFKGSSIRGISIAQNGVVWLSGSKGLVARSVDDGGTWTQVPAPDTDSLDFRSIHAFSRDEVIISSAGFPCRIYKTKDGGKQWQLVYENIDSNAFINSILFYEENKGIAFGDVIAGRHLILNSQDQGETWNRSDSGEVPSPRLDENGFAASNSCIAFDGKNTTVIALGGKNVRVLRSEDKGKTWEFYDTPLQTESPYGGVYAISYANGSFIGVGGDFSQADSLSYAIISEDGIRWRLSSTALKGYRSTIHYCGKAKIWLAAGTNGMDQSADNGQSWKNVDSTDLNILRFLPDQFVAIAADSRGNVFRIELKTN